MLLILLLVQPRPGNGPDLALSGILFTVYFGCCIHFWYTYRRGTAGAFITISGFFLWACVFVTGPMTQVYLPHLHVESEVWNLPKFVVGIGMILLLLEEKIEHNKHLALHDALTSLPNRRLFQDRLSSSLERARRNGTQAALLVIDLDRFKQVNDSLGHHVGDLLLKHAANLISGRIRRSDTVARDRRRRIHRHSGGPDKWLRGTPRRSNVAGFGQRTCASGSSFGSDRRQLCIAVFPDDATEMEQLCIAAYLRMYNKRAGYKVSDGPHHTPRRLCLPAGRGAWTATAPDPVICDSGKV
jgi:hypothetical protein